jgi:hypothetical protein
VPDNTTSLLLGEGRLGHALCVRPTSARPELGNLLVVAPTSGGKGLSLLSASFSPGPTQLSSCRKDRGICALSLRPDADPRRACCLRITAFGDQARACDPVSQRRLCPGKPC